MRAQDSAEPEGPIVGCMGMSPYGCWETFYICAYCGLVVEIQPLNCENLSFCSPSNVNQVMRKSHREWPCFWLALARAVVPSVEFSELLVTERCALAGLMSGWLLSLLQALVILKGYVSCCLLGTRLNSRQVRRLPGVARLRRHLSSLAGWTSSRETPTTYDHGL